MKTQETDGVVVVSLFDGMSCGMIALEQAGVKVDEYYASEIDKPGQEVSEKNYPKIKRLGDVRNVTGDILPKFANLLIGGSPCQSFSLSGKREGMSTDCKIDVISLDQYLELKAQDFRFKGQSYLFWEYVRVLKELQKTNPEIKFLLENVLMPDKWRKVITQTLGVNPIYINSSRVSAQVRKRLYWTNIGTGPNGLLGSIDCLIPQPKDEKIKLSYILQESVDEKYFLNQDQIDAFVVGEVGDKILIREATKKGVVAISPGECFDAERPKSLSRRGRTMKIKSNCLMAKSCEFVYYTPGGRIRKFTPVECERLQTVPDNYTNHVSDSHRYRMLGNGWTIKAITHILKHW